MNRSLLFGLVVLSVGLLGCGGGRQARPKPAPADARAAAPPPPPMPPPESAPLFKMTDVAVGTGELAVPGRQVAVHYRGSLANGTALDESYTRNAPVSFTLGMGQVIPGWDRGINGMKVGGKRQLVIPPEMGYGAEPTPDPRIPLNATLLYDVELVAVGDPPPPELPAKAGKVGKAGKAGALGAGASKTKKAGALGPGPAKTKKAP